MNISNIYTQEDNLFGFYVFHNLITILVPLFIVLAYKSSMKTLVGYLELNIALFFILIFPSIYEFYKSGYYYLWLIPIIDITIFAIIIDISSIISIKSLEKRLKELQQDINNEESIEKRIENEIGNWKFSSLSLYTFRTWIKKFGYMKYFLYGIYWLLYLLSLPANFLMLVYLSWSNKYIMVEQIGYLTFIIILNILILLTFLFCLCGRLCLGLYFYTVTTTALNLSIVYSNNLFFTDLILAIMAYLLGRMFDSEALIGKKLKMNDNKIMGLANECKVKSIPILKYFFYFYKTGKQITKENKEEKKKEVNLWLDWLNFNLPEELA
ncbi:6215_t:CDS:1 [Dentiscutata erythropus]|uniref:6215_t:CDS:1 n=1 Tax=Dentiscutata erythropus TaxID=1348616 RepID=A0A9N9AQ65_9GLOM|nr:6215_t:CDS:1 [Dentiscutata erythropus]